MLGASGDPEVPGSRLPLRRGRALVDAEPHRAGGRLRGASARRTTPTWRRRWTRFAERKFGPGGPSTDDTPGAWTDSPGVPGQRPGSRTSSRPASPLQAQYILDTFGKFPGTVPTLFILNYVQAHHLDLDFYDRFFKPGRLPAAPTPSTWIAGTVAINIPGGTVRFVVDS